LKLGEKLSQLAACELPLKVFTDSRSATAGGK